MSSGSGMVAGAGKAKQGQLTGVNALIQDILVSPARVIVVDAIAGSGKTALLAAIGARCDAAVTDAVAQGLERGGPVLLLDLPSHLTDFPDLAILLQWVAHDPVRRVVIAKRPSCAIAGIERAVLSGQAAIVRERDLWGPADDGTGGWPILRSGLARDPDNQSLLTGYLRQEVVEDLPLDALFVLERLTEGEGDIKLSLDIAAQAACRPVSALIAPGAIAGTLRFGAPLARAAMGQAVRERLAQEATPASALQKAMLLRRLGQMPAAILALIAAGRTDTALEWFEAEGGSNFIYFYGNAAFDAVIDGFPAATAQSSDVLTMAQALRSLKNGHVESAHQTLLRHYGPNALEMSKVFAANSGFSLQYCAFRCVVAIYEETAISDQMIERMFGVVEQLPEDDYLRRGNVYNALLELYVRRRRWPEAESMAARALDNYQRARAPMLSFYVQLFQALLASVRGNIATAQTHAAAARASLDSTGFESEKDYRLLRLLDAAIAYETGDAEPLVAFMTTDFDKFADSEIWPSLVEFSIQYGAQALSEQVSSFAAIDFLDRWRIHRWPARSLRNVIEITEATILQNANRWLQAAAKLSALQSRISRIWVEAASDELPLLTERDDIAITLAWMRNLVFDIPTRPLLLRQIGLMLANHHLTRRQRIMLLVWDAYVRRRQNDLTYARASLLRALEDAARLRCLAPLREETTFLREVVADQRIFGFLKTSSVARQVLRRLEEISLPRTNVNLMVGLTRREARILLLIAEGGSNKFVARTLGVSEATVKYHLTNLYRKLGCSGRVQAIATARSLGWIG